MCVRMWADGRNDLIAAAGNGSSKNIEEEIKILNYFFRLC